MKNQNGEITINMTAPASGQKIISGKVGAMNAQGKMEWRAYSTKIAVAEGTSASGSFENAEMNVLYVGYANKIIPTVSGVDDYSLSSGTPTTIDGKKAYIIKPTSKGPMTLTLTGKKGKKSFTFTKTYKCKDFPKPELVQRSISKSGQNLDAQSSPESLVPAQFSITKVILLDGLENPEIQGSYIPKSYLTKLRVGKEVGVTCYFKNLLTGANGEIQGRLRILQ